MWDFLGGLLSGASGGCLLVVVVVLILAFIALVQEWIVPGSAYRRKVAESDYWRDIAVPGLQMSKNLVAAVKREA